MSRKIEISTSTSDVYTITIGYDLWQQVVAYLSENFSKQKLLVIVDENVMRLYGDHLWSILEQTFEKVIIHQVPSGEESKSLQRYSEILDTVLNAGVERKTPLLAIGGGVTGDLAGFAAASVLRGVPLVHVPTTLLAMVDSSIGGKTGINHAAGKNLIGAFYQPKAVFADLKFLETLPQREWLGGLSEILKYGFIRDRSIFGDLETLIDVGSKEFKPASKWQELIHKSASIKADIVTKDVKEAGLREFLNFGHTFAHVIEKQGNYTIFTHGEAVFMGMLAAIFVSNEKGAQIDENLLLKYKSMYNLSLNHALEHKELVRVMLHDKKVTDSTIRLILLKQLEQPITLGFTDTALIEQAWDFIIQEFN